MADNNEVINPQDMAPDSDNIDNIIEDSATNSAKTYIEEEETDSIIEDSASADVAVETKPSYTVPGMGDRRTVLSGMFQQWYLEYASYVILERAVPHIDDGLKPVQRRILHSMQRLDDGRFNKVANIVGNTMQFHPHGDASIGDALVQLGQKELLIDTQGNWGNILTGDSAAAPRYIEARLSEFALETLFSPKICEWTPSYDGRQKEPVTLPVKFPLLLVQGVEGIAVGLSSKILPHNFNEVTEAAISYLKGEDFQLYPDFQTGGFLDVGRYNDGARGGNVKVRAKIEKIDNKTLAITELPFGKTTSTLISSILTAMEKGKIKIRKVDDNTSATAEIVVHLIPGTSSDKAIDALYAFTDCEISISPNCCVIMDKKPHFMSVGQLLRHSVDRTSDLLRRELEIKLGETREVQFFASLEKIFIEQRIYKDKETEQAPDMDSAVAHVEKRLEPFLKDLFRSVTREDIMRLWEIRMGRILKFNTEKADEKIANLQAEIDKLQHNLAHIREFTIEWFTHLKDKYGEHYPRRTTLRNFDSIVATKVAEANKRLYFDKEGGFVGTGLKEGEFLFPCSDIDDILIIYRDGSYKITKVQEKLFVGKGKKSVIHIGLYKKGDERTIYNVIYRNGPSGSFSYKKRFAITALTRDKEYFIGKEENSRIEYMSVNPNGEAEVVKVNLYDKPDLFGKKPRTLETFVNFAELKPRGKESLGNLVTKYQIKSVVLEKAGTSTLGGREVWFDRDVLRLNYEGRGESLGIFQGNDLILVVTKNGEFYTTDFSDSNHYEDDILLIEKFEPDKVWTVVLHDATLGFPYIKRMTFEPSAKPQRYVGTDESSRQILLTATPYPRLELTFGGNDSMRPKVEIDAEEYISVKSFKAKGKRLTNYTLAEVKELEPLRFPTVSEAQQVTLDTDDEETPEQETENPKVVQPDLFDFNGEEKNE